MGNTALKTRLRNFARAFGEFIYGATVYDWVRELDKERGRLQSIFILIVFGDFLGVPIIPPYYQLRLLPHIVPYISTWKRSMLREPDITEIFDEDMG